jgi:hypothetical protein
MNTVAVAASVEIAENSPTPIAFVAYWLGRHVQAPAELWGAVQEQ